MNLIEELQQEVHVLFPMAKLELDDPPENDTGKRWLDMSIDGERKYSFEWRPEKGIGLYVHTPESAYGEGPDHVAETVEESLAQLLGVMTRTLSNGCMEL